MQGNDEEDWQQNGTAVRKWNGRGAGHAVGGGEIEDSDDQDKNVHPIVKKIEKERRDARQAQEMEQEDEPVELNDIEVDSGRPLGQMYQNFQEQEDSNDENAPNQNQHYPQNNNYGDPAQQYQYNGQMRQQEDEDSEFDMQADQLNQFTERNQFSGRRHNPGSYRHAAAE